MREKLEKNKKYVALGVAALLLLILSSVAYAYMSGDPAVNKVKAKLDEIEAKGENLSFEERMGAMKQIEDMTKRFSDKQMDQVRDYMWQKGEQKADAKLHSYFKMSPEDQQAAMKKLVDDQVKREADMAKNGGQPGGGFAGGRPGGGGPGGGGPGGAPGGPPGAAPGATGGPGGGAPGGQPGAQGGQPGGPQRKPSTPEERSQRRKNFIYRSTSDTRAERTEYVHHINDERAARGLPPMSTRETFGALMRLGGGPGGGRGPGGPPGGGPGGGPGGPPR